MSKRIFKNHAKTKQAFKRNINSVMLSFGKIFRGNISLYVLDRYSKVESKVNNFEVQREKNYNQIRKQIVTGKQNTRFEKVFKLFVMYFGVAVTIC